MHHPNSMHTFPKMLLVSEKHLNREQTERTENVETPKTLRKETNVSNLVSKYCTFGGTFQTKRLFISSEYQFNTFERIGNVFDTSLRLLLIGNTAKTEFKEKPRAQQAKD